MATREFAKLYGLEPTVVCTLLPIRRQDKTSISLRERKHPSKPLDAASLLFTFTTCFKEGSAVLFMKSRNTQLVIITKKVARPYLICFS